MGIRPKTYFTWKEPKPFLAASDELERSSRRWWHRPLGILIIVAVFMLCWYISHFDPTKHPIGFRPALLLAFVGAVSFVYFLPWLVRKCPSTVAILDRHLYRSRGNRHSRIRFADLTAFSWGSTPEFSTLILTSRHRGRQVFIGVPHDIPTDALSAFLSERIPAEGPERTSVQI